MADYLIQLSLARGVCRSCVEHIAEGYSGLLCPFPSEARDYQMQADITNKIEILESRHGQRLRYTFHWLLKPLVLSTSNAATLILPPARTNSYCTQARAIK